MWRRGGALAAARRRAGTPGAGAYALVLSAVAVGVVGLAGMLTGQPYLIPALGPTAIMFFESPTSRSSSAVCTLTGHGIAVVVGLACLWAFGLADNPSFLVEGITAPRVGAAALSVALTAFLIRLATCPHPPAGTTTLLISLGVLTSPGELVAIVVGVVLITVLGVGLNRLLGVAQPILPGRGE